MHRRSWWRTSSKVCALLMCLMWMGFGLGCNDSTGKPCTSGQSVGCVCGSSRGVQTCTSGVWDACNCTPSQCKTGAVLACTCGTQTGSQSCTNGTWGACSCVSGHCKEGQTLVCACPNGAAGSQSCSGGVWSACTGCGTLPKPSTSCTQPDTQKACVCSSGKQGVQRCGADKKWSACSCSSTHPTCAVGQSQACTCVDGRTGAQPCVSGGLWGACTCNGPTRCKQGQTQVCVCDNAGVGQQSCVQSGTTWSWGKCTQCTDPKASCEKPGSSKQCECSNGAKSWKECGADKKWKPCDCGQSCTEGDIRKNDCDCPSGFRGDNKCTKSASGQLYYVCQCACTAQETRECACPNNQKGKRTCKSNNQWGACACPTCKTDAECKTLAPALVCNPKTKQCVECLKKEDCPGGKVCLGATSSCVECLTDQECTTAGTSCYPLDHTCKTFGRGTLTGFIQRCRDAAGNGQCKGNPPAGDDQGHIYMLFFSGKRFPPSYDEKPFLVKKLPLISFKDPAKKVPYTVEHVPEGKWLVYVFLDDNANWSAKQHMPDTGDLVGFSTGVTIQAQKTATFNFALIERY